MQKILYILFLTLFSLSLEAYSKKIILASFSTQERADAMIASLPTRSPSLYKLSKKYNFDIKMKVSGKYYILVAEVFTNKEVLTTSFKSVKKRFKGSYITNYKAPKVFKEEKKVTKKVIKTILKEPVIKKEIIVEVLKEKVTKKVTQKEIMKEKEKELMFYEEYKVYFSWYYILIFFILSICTYYYIKFKRIYDEY